MSKAIFNNQVMPAADKMYRYALSILNDRETAQDVVQDCLAKIWKNRDKLPRIQNVDSWVMRITRNQCYDWVKVNRFSLSGDGNMTKYANSMAGDMTADSQTSFNDQMYWLKQVVGSLPQKQREVYHLREVEEMTYQDIAEILSLNLSEVKVTLHRTRQKIRAKITKIEAYGLAN